jgi:hypothetical protein
MDDNRYSISLAPKIALAVAVTGAVTLLLVESWTMERACPDSDGSTCPVKRRRTTGWGDGGAHITVAPQPPLGLCGA